MNLNQTSLLLMYYFFPGQEKFYFLEYLYASHIKNSSNLRSQACFHAWFTVNTNVGEET
jgi:hypothetical protein